jgi:hypothetical protein
MRLALALALLLAAAGCDNSRADAVLIGVVDCEGSTPLTDIASGSIRIRVTQADQVHDQTYPIASGTFDAIVPLDSYAPLTNVQVAIADERDALRTIGVAYDFVPGSAGAVWVVMGAPSTCCSVRDPRIADGRIDAAVVPFPVNYLVLGGLRSTAIDAVGHADVGVLAPIQLTFARAFTTTDERYPPLSRPIGATRAVRLGGSNDVLVLADRPFLYRNDPSEPMREVDLAAPHAMPGSALVDLGSQGAALIGGASTRSQVISWVTSAGVVETTALAFPRSGAAAVAIGDGILVAGGQAEGDPLLEYVALRSDGVAVDPTRATRLDVPILVRDPMARSAMLVGGTDAAGVIRTETSIVSGCPACGVSPGPAPWAAPRREVAVAETERSALLLGGSDASGMLSAVVDRVVFADATTASFEQAYASLPEPRSRAAAVPIGSGVVMLVGGLGTSDEPARAIDLCWPQALEDMPAL